MHSCYHYLLHFVRSCSYSWPKKSLEDIPEKYRSIVDACLTVDPAVRPSIDRVLEMLDASPLLESEQPGHFGVDTYNRKTVEEKTELTTPDVPNLIDL